MPALSSLLLAVGLVALAGCGSSSSGTKTSPTPAATTSSPAATTPAATSGAGQHLTLDANREGQF
jgi:hypothetical protein